MVRSLLTNGGCVENAMDSSPSRYLDLPLKRLPFLFPLFRRLDTGLRIKSKDSPIELPLALDLLVLLLCL